jgi:hypothetical protein
MALAAPIDPSTIEPLETHCEWTSDTLGDRYVWHLTDDDRAELDAAVGHAGSRHDDLLDVTSDDFPLPTLGPRLAEAARTRLIDGDGVLLITDVDLSGYDRRQAELLYWGVGTHLGRPWPQNAKGHLLGDVTDQGRSGADPTSRGNEIGGVAFPFHSDGSDLVGLFCLDPGAAGGASLVANALAIHNHLARTEPDLLAELYGPFAYDMRGEHAEGRQPWYLLPVFTRWGDRLFTRYIRPYIHSARRHADAPAPSPAAVAAMDRLDALCADPTHHASMQLHPGDMQFVNNHHVLHARDAYEDDRPAGKVRHLKRLWLETRVLDDEQKPTHARLDRSAAHWWRAAGRTPPG